MHAFYRAQIVSGLAHHLIVCRYIVRLVSLCLILYSITVTPQAAGKEPQLVCLGGYVFLCCDTTVGLSSSVVRCAYYGCCLLACAHHCPA